MGYPKYFEDIAKLRDHAMSLIPDPATRNRTPDSYKEEREKFLAAKSLLEGTARRLVEQLNRLLEYATDPQICILQQINDLKAKLVDLQSEFGQTCEDNQTLGKKLTFVESENDKLRNETAALKEKLRNEIATLKDQQHSSAAEKAKLLKQICELEVDIRKKDQYLEESRIFKEVMSRGGTKRRQ